ncbi:fungal-specific transcription factor domain-containing protein, partial [Geopyxis carbonaria]
RKKRAQVSRACDMCRLHRIKCDNNPECSSCINRGVRCTNSGSKPAYTLSSAIQRIEELEELSKRLKEELALYKKSGAISPANQEAGAGSPSGAESSSGTRRHVDTREGLSSVDPTTEQTEFYGSTSPFYFFAKISSFLTTNKTLPPLSTVIPHLAACDLATPAKGKGGNDYSMLNPEDEFSRAQQDYFLGLYWQSYHVMLPVISQKEFREHYESLWPDPELYPNQPRKPSPLVDIVLALCAQYGTNSVVPVHRENLQGGNPAASNNASIAGSGYFRRCQAALVTSLEKPTMVAVQCYILTIFYLLNASYTNMAYNTLGLAIRLAHTLGYYREPNPELPEPKKQLLRRIWWVLYALDIRLALDTGRPLGLQEHQITCNLPSDVEDAGLNGGLSNPSGSSNGNFSWLSFILHGAKLYTVCHMILKVVYCILWQRARDPTPPNIEEIGLNLTKSMPPLLQWRDNLPAQLKPARKNGGTPMSTDMTPVEFDYFTPMWLQRQRLTAEMHWHNFGVILHRGFICFSPSTAQTPIADGHAITCMKHARANTALIHQVLTQTDVLNGWYETYYFQWSATMTIIGFLLSYPFYPHAQEARASVDTGLEVFDLFAVNYPAAGHSARITREFLANIDPLL